MNEPIDVDFAPIEDLGNGYVTTELGTGLLRGVAIKQKHNCYQVDLVGFRNGIPKRYELSPWNTMKSAKKTALYILLESLEIEELMVLDHAEAGQDV